MDGCLCAFLIVCDTSEGCAISTPVHIALVSVSSCQSIGHFDDAERHEPWHVCRDSSHLCGYKGRGVHPRACEAVSSREN